MKSILYLFILAVLKIAVNGVNLELLNNPNVISAAEYKTASAPIPTNAQLAVVDPSLDAVKDLKFRKKLIKEVTKGHTLPKRFSQDPSVKQLLRNRIEEAEDRKQLNNRWDEWHNKHLQKKEDEEQSLLGKNHPKPCKFDCDEFNRNVTIANINVPNTKGPCEYVDDNKLNAKNPDGSLKKEVANQPVVVDKNKKNKNDTNNVKNVIEVVKSSNSTTNSTKLTSNTTQPVNNTTKPATNTTKPVATSTNPVVVSSKPVVNSTTTNTNSTGSANNSTSTSTKPNDTTVKPAVATATTTVNVNNTSANTTNVSTSSANNTATQPKPVVPSTNTSNNNTTKPVTNTTNTTLPPTTVNNQNNTAVVTNTTKPATNTTATNKF